MTAPPEERRLRVGMVGLGMIFDETYRPVLEQLRTDGLYVPGVGAVAVELTATATRTGERAERLLRESSLGPFASFHGPSAIQSLLEQPVDVVCIATPDDRHFDPARAALSAGKHVLIEKPSVLRLQELDELTQLALCQDVLAKVVYHKLFDPDHKRLRTLVADNVLRHCNNGYCSLLEPKQISTGQFAEWVQGRNPASYVAVHYVKLIDFSFFQAGQARLRSVSATGQRGLVASPAGATWDSVQTRIVYAYLDGREAAFDIHTSWVHPDDFPGYVEQEVQFRFDNGVWNASQRRRGVEVVVEGRAGEFKTTPNHHYNAECLEPWGERRRRGYGLEAVERFFREVAFVEWGGPTAERVARLQQLHDLAYNDIGKDRQAVAVVQAVEAILARHAGGEPGGVVYVDGPRGGLVLSLPGQSETEVLYPLQVMRPEY